jgi:hypothetical protein
MPIFAFHGKDKKDDLEEVKRLALGKDGENPQPLSQNSGQSPTKTPPSQLQKDLEAFKEEQKIFTQVTSVKELSGEQIYEIPAVLQSTKEEKLLPFQENPPEEKVTSAFEKLLNLESTPLEENRIDKSIKTAYMPKPAFIPRKIEEKTDANAKTVSLSNTTSQKPLIQQKKQAAQTKIHMKKNPILQNKNK